MSIDMGKFRGLLFDISSQPVFMRLYSQPMLNRMRPKSLIGDWDRAQTRGAPD